MLFDKNSFLLDVASGDMTIRLSDATGTAKYLIKDPDATLTAEGRSVRVHQRADTAPMVLDFPSPRDAREAMTALQAALLKLRRNASNNGNGEGFGGKPDSVYVEVTYDKQAAFNLGFQPDYVHQLYVNGQLVYPDEYHVTASVLTWESKQYDLEPTDIVLLEYYGKLDDGT